MSNYVALLRAVNLAGRNVVSMDGLRALARGLGFRDVRTLLQSGNILFSSDTDADAALELRFEERARNELGVETDFMVRSGAEVRQAIDGNPFPEQAKRDPARLVVVFLKAAPRADSVGALRAAIKGREVVEARGRELYIVYPDGIGRSKLTMAIMEKHLGTRGTGRNWNTVLKLAEMSQA